MDLYSNYLERAGILIKQRRFEDAKKEIQKALEINPSGAEAFSSYAKCCFDNGEFDLGIEKAHQALSINPENPYYYYLLSFGYYRKGKLKKAEDLLEKAISMAPYSSEFYSLLAQVFILGNQFGKALDKANEGLYWDAENISCLNARSTALNKLRRTDEAIETMEFALSMDPENDLTHSTVAWNFLEKGKYRESAHHFKEVLRLNPRSQNAQEGLKKALSSKIPPYRWLLQFEFWLSNKGRNFARFFPITFLFLVRALASGLEGNKSTSVWAGVIIAVYFILVISTWLIRPLANFFLVFDKDGKYALSHTEKWSSMVSVGSIGMGIVFLAFIPFVLNNEKWQDALAISGGCFIIMAIPLSLLKFPIAWNRYDNKNKLGLLMILLGIITILTAFPLPTISLIFGTLFLILVVLNTWFNVFKN